MTDPNGAPSASTRIAPSDLVPDFEAHEGAGVLNEYAYWMGLTANCPAHLINCVELSFSKVNELIVPDVKRPGRMTRVPAIGGLNRNVTANHIAALRERLPRMVIRFTEARESPRDQHEEPGTGLNIGDAHLKIRKGFVITIPSAEQVKAYRAAKVAIPTYTRRPDDEPAARYMYFHFCENQDDPKRGAEYPPTIEEAGIFWPDELVEAEADLLS